jgi:hypothetical protein
MWSRVDKEAEVGKVTFKGDDALNDDFTLKSNNSEVSNFE